MAPAAAHASENISSAIDLKALPPFYARKNGILLYFLLTSSLVSSMASGFDGVSTASIPRDLNHALTPRTVVYDERYAAASSLA